MIMDNLSLNNDNSQCCQQVFCHNQDKYGYAVLIVHSSNHNDWHNNVTMKDLYSKGYYQ